MTSPTGRPEFFVLEAGEHLERVALLVRQSDPEPEDLLRFSRALRSSALMAGPTGYSVAAGALEDLALRYHAGHFAWTPHLGVRVAEAVEHCRELLRRARQWSTDDIAACRRIAEGLLPTALEDGVVPIESLAPDFETPVVAIESLAPEADTGSDIVAIESLLYDEPAEAVATSPHLTPRTSHLNAFERSFSTYFRLMRGGSRDEEGADEAVPIQHLLYRGQRALDRARRVREELAVERRGRAEAELLDSLVDELLDLVPLALEHD